MSQQFVVEDNRTMRAGEERGAQDTGPSREWLDLGYMVGQHPLSRHPARGAVWPLFECAGTHDYWLG